MASRPRPLRRLLACLGGGLCCSCASGSGGLPHLNRGLAAQAAGAVPRGPQQQMSQLFPTWEALEAAPGVQGLTWDLLQGRCAPGVAMGQTQGGWISDGTPIKRVLRRDWELVRQLGSTHLELVAHLDAVYEEAQPCDFEHPKTAIEYDARRLPGNTLRSDGPVQLELSCYRHRGIQQDLLHPEEWNRGWNVVWTVSDGARRLEIGGRNSSTGLLEYTKLFGFYEGGRDNAYRVAPEAIADLLTAGEATHHLRQAGVLEDRFHEECWTAGGCTDDGAAVCPWCGTHEGEHMRCCRRDWTYATGHPCFEVRFSDVSNQHRCVSQATQSMAKVEVAPVGVAGFATVGASGESRGGFAATWSHHLVVFVVGLALGSIALSRRMRQMCFDTTAPVSQLIAAQE